MAVTHEDDVAKNVASNMVIEDDVVIKSVRIISDADALREINNFTTSRQMSVAEIAVHTVLPFEQIERILQR